jgi:hypothetical protein
MYFLMTVLEASGEGYLSFVEDGIQQPLVATSQPRGRRCPPPDISLIARIRFRVI